MSDKNLVEVARSFSLKVNLGNYESCDFFCSQKAEVPTEDAEKTSEALYDFCRAEVIKSVKKYQREKLPKLGNTKEAVEQWEKHKEGLNN